MTIPNNTLSTQSPTREQFQQELQRIKEEYEEILLIKDQQLQIKEETIAACRQEINYLRNMVDGLLKQPTVAELVSTAEQIKANLKRDTPDDEISKNLLREDLENVLDALSPHEEDVLRLRYGLDDHQIKTLEEIGQIFNVTREQIRQIEAKALRKLRHPNRLASPVVPQSSVSGLEVFPNINQSQTPMNP